MKYKVLIGLFVLAVSLGITVNLSQKSQETRNRAVGGEQLPACKCPYENNIILADVSETGPGFAAGDYNCDGIISVMDYSMYRQWVESGIFPDYCSMPETDKKFWYCDDGQCKSVYSLELCTFLNKVCIEAETCPIDYCPVPTAAIPTETPIATPTVTIAPITPEPTDFITPTITLTLTPTPTQIIPTITQTPTPTPTITLTPTLPPPPPITPEPTDFITPTIIITPTDTPIICSDCTLAGDYSCNGSIDGGDYVVWRGEYFDKEIGSVLKSDGNCDGKVSLVDYSKWREKYLL